MNRRIRRPEWSRVVKPRKNRVDQKNRHMAAGKSRLVKPSTPILYCSHSRQEEESENSCSIVYRYEIRVDRLTTSAFWRCRTGVSLVNPRNRRVDRVDHVSGEVTL